MRTIGGVALGTYYAAGAQAARATPNASAMRGLVYAVKDNRDPPNPKQFVAHPSHPSPRPVAVDRTNAIEDVTAILGRRIANLAKFFGARDPPRDRARPGAVVRGRGRDRGDRSLPDAAVVPRAGRVGLGRVAVLAVQREPVVAKTSGSRRTGEEILRGFVRTSMPVPRSDVVVLVDDNVQSGNSLAALDHLLGGVSTAAFAVAVTDAEACKNALKPRRFTIDYDEAAPSLRVTRTLGPVR